MEVDSMPWERKSIMTQREEFVRYYEENANMSKACRQAGISRPTGYKWWKRYKKEGLKGLKNRSKRPKNSPNMTSSIIEQQVLKIRKKQKGDWGGRKIKRRMEVLGYDNIPAASTITEILRRNDKIKAEESKKREHYTRFEKKAPNQLWQMDFKGHFEITGGRCHPLTVLDDHSRFSLVLKACLNERRETVKKHLTEAFITYGMPDQMLMDNGAPWGSSWNYRHTKFTIWLMELGILPKHSRPYHPQTQGKEERFHRTFKEAIENNYAQQNLEIYQPLFDDWRYEYNYIRPHEALDLQVPADKYKRSEKDFPLKIYPWDYSSDLYVRKVDGKGRISFKNKTYTIGKGFVKKYVGLKEIGEDEKMDVYFRKFKIKQIDLKL
jgi:transposase InsO family protein